MTIQASNVVVQKDIQGRVYAQTRILWGHNLFPGVSVYGLAPLPTAPINLSGAQQTIGNIRGAVINNRLSHSPIILQAPDTSWEAVVPALCSLKTGVITTGMTLNVIAPGGTMQSDQTTITLTNFDIPPSLEVPTDVPPYLPGSNNPTWVSLPAANMTAGFSETLFAFDGLSDHFDLDISGVTVSVAANLIFNLRAFNGPNTIWSTQIDLPAATLDYAKLWQMRAPAKLYCDGGLILQYVINSGTVTSGFIGCGGRIL